MKLCESCGQPIYNMNDLEQRLSRPILWLLEQYALWGIKRERDGRKESNPVL